MTMLAGEVVQLTPNVRRVLAPNPGLYTGPGTNTYLVGTEDIAVIDPGPDDSEQHLDTVAEAGQGRIRWILVTHTHPDHSPGAAGLKKRTGAPLLGFDERDGFVPDDMLGDGDGIEGTGFRLTALHTPGHAPNHLCYHLEGERLLFSGDHIMSGSTVVIAPPEGDMRAYLQALDRLRRVEMSGVAPGHGPFIEDGQAKVEEYIAHRQAREAAIKDALDQQGEATIAELVAAVYTDVPEALHPIARYSVWAHLRKLLAEGRAASRQPEDISALWRGESAS
ncbi:MAG TPA: MBL fold metallo-hydrolase [Acidimicrobiales bacterium]|jgi:glyoxylase-like metal-dependent hydrolase (beta-lactamase superfamily II)|nr:MBL fold metallo-hydrolase [Acidimicrobiales bacterium]